MKVDRSPTTKRDTMENEKKTVARGAGTPGGTAALYARLSKKDEGNIRAQLDVLQEWAVRLGYDTTIEYSDRASGITPNRPKLDLLMKDVQSGEIDAVLVVRIDRIMRSVLNLLLVTETLTTYGTALRVHDQPIDTSTSMGRFFLVVLAALAEYERELIRDRTSAGLVRAKKEGRKGGGKFRTLPPGVLEKLVLDRE
jgi:site-specific DNA recombinase